MSEPVLCAADGCTGRMTLIRPEVLNAIGYRHKEVEALAQLIVAVPVNPRT